MVTAEEDPPPRSETSLENQVAGNDNSQNTGVQQIKKNRRCGHIIITSSIGKDIDGDQLAPQATNRVVVKAFSGAMVEDLKGFVERTPFQHKSVTVLVGGMCGCEIHNMGRTLCSPIKSKWGKLLSPNRPQIKPSLYTLTSLNILKAAIHQHGTDLGVVGVEVWKRLAILTGFI